jgi:hypothetical protein
VRLLTRPGPPSPDLVPPPSRAQKGGPAADSVQALADEVAAWMGVGGVVTQGSKALPASVVVERSGSQSAS